MLPTTLQLPPGIVLDADNLANDHRLLAAAVHAPPHPQDTRRRSRILFLTSARRRKRGRGAAWRRLDRDTSRTCAGLTYRRRKEFIRYAKHSGHADHRRYNPARQLACAVWAGSPSNPSTNAQSHRPVCRGAVLVNTPTLVSPRPRSQSRAQPRRVSTRALTAPIQLYQLLFSHHCEKIRWVLDYKGIAYRTINLLPSGLC
jgi:hypothetical protein